MSIVVVGGPSKGVGKTTLICGILNAMPERNWTAIKITSHGYHGVSLHEDVTGDTATDTGRYLLAGAKKALLIEAPGDESLAELAKEIRAQGENLIIESNRIAGQLAPEVCLGVLGDGLAQEKPSYAAFLPHVDALVARAGDALPGDWRSRGVPLFAMKDFSCVPAELLDWIRARISPRARLETARS